MSQTISEFKGRYFFLSNFFPAPVIVWGRRFQSNEAAFQAAKCPSRMDEFCGLDPSKAKRLGRQVQLRPDWEDVKDEIMRLICKAKFIQNPGLMDQLIKTGDAQLVEGNTWGDRVWGVCNGAGENRLGKILMALRQEFTTG